MTAWLHLITDLGDTIVLLWLVVAAAIFLAASGHFRLLVGWGLAVALCAVATLGLKWFSYTSPDLALIRSGIMSRYFPSGHASMATVVYGGVAVLLHATLSRRWQWLPWVAASAIVVSIGYSRVALGAHAPGDVLAGLMLGAASLVFLVHAMQRNYRLRLRAAPFAATLGIVAVAFYISLPPAFNDDLRRLAEPWRFKIARQ